MERRNRSIFYRFRWAFRVLGVTFFFTVALAAAYLLSKMGPAPVDSAQAYGEFDEEMGTELLVQAEEYEQEFRLLANQRHPTEEDYAILDQAIEALTEYIALRDGFHAASANRREALYDLRDELRGKRLFEESVELENQAMDQIGQENHDEALSLLERSRYQQKRINDEFSRSSYADTRRLTRLSREVMKWKAKPVYEESLAKENEATKAIAEERFERAKTLLEEAIALQKNLNRDFRSLRVADVGRLSYLEERLASLESSEDHEAIEGLMARAESLENEGKFAEAAAAYQQALRQQRQLNLTYPRSRFAGTRKLDEIQSRREAAMSRELGEGILTEMAQFDEMLRQRRVSSAIEALRALYPKAEQFSEQFPRSDILPEDSLLKLEYLSAIEDKIAIFQDRVEGQLLPVDGIPNVRLLRTEVAQVLYESIMLGANPSRNRGLRLPVDSLNWQEATDFAQRVSWILGRDARLPKEDEFYAALGSLRYVDLRAASWHLENSDSQTHEIATKEPNAQGFHDLLGNVAEWLFSESLTQGGEAHLVGGSAETSIDALAEVPLEIVNQRSRNRFGGFRIIVIYD